MSRWRCLGVVAALTITGCQSGPVVESDAATIQNRAETLQRAADATTDDLIGQIDQESATATASASNAADVNAEPPK